MGCRKWVVLGCLSIIFFFDTTAFSATGGSTGGGNVVSCTDPLTHMKTYRLLDYYEAETLMPELLPELSKGKTELEKVDFVLDRLEKHDAKRARKYRAIARDFFKNAQFILNKVLPDINDHGYVPKEPHCVIEQLAVQNISPFAQVKKYVIREEFWKKLSVEDRAGLILHEVIYEEAMAVGQKTSRNSRYFNALVSSKRLETMSAADYEDRLERVGFTDSGSQPTVPAPWEISATNFKASPGNLFMISLPDYIINGENVPFRFTLMGGPAWISVSLDGRIFGRPTRQDLGESATYVSVDDGKQKVIANIQITVSELRDDKLPMAIVGIPYNTDLMTWSPIRSGIKSIGMSTGPRWLGVQGNQLVGTPSALDVGAFSVQIDYDYQVIRDLHETQPDGSIKVRRVTEVRTQRVSLAGSVRSQPPLGREVQPDEFEEVVPLTVGNSSCLGTIIGPRVVMTAAHCAQAGSKGVFHFGGNDYSAIFTRSPIYPRTDHDMALGVTKTDIVGARPLTVSGVLTVGATVNVVAMAMDRPSKRDTEVQITGLSGLDAIAEHPKGPVIYYGDSGAPAFVDQNNGIAGFLSKGGATPNGSFGSLFYLTRTDLPESQSFLKDFATANYVDICGVNRYCLP